MDWRAITAYTPEYENNALQLRATLDKLAITLTEYPFRSFGDWVRNCAHTVDIAIHALRELERPIVWLDADARVLKFPDLFGALTSLDVDIAVHKRMNKDGVGWHYNSGTIYFANNERVVAFLEDQVKRLQDYRVTVAGHYPYTDFMLRNTDHGLSIYELPLEYSYIEGSEQPEEQIPFGRVVILHTQASRQLSKIVNQGGRE